MCVGYCDQIIIQIRNNAFPPETYCTVEMKDVQIQCVMSNMTRIAVATRCHFEDLEVQMVLSLT